MLEHHLKEKMSSLPISYADICLAQERIGPTLPATPISVLSCPKIQHQVHLKLDILQRTGSFKERGALNALLQIQAEGKTKDVIGASAGNHAQAVSYHASKLGMNVSMIMPVHTPINKVLSTQKWGAKVQLMGDTVDQGIKIAKERAAASGEAFIHAFDDPEIIAGQGVCGLEILQQVKDIDYMVVPIGGGGYISGIATVIKHVSPKTKVIGVQTEGYPHIARAYQGKAFQLDAHASTIADGIAVKGIGQYTLPIIKELVDEIVLVNDKEIAHAILYLLQNRKILAEGAGASGFAAILSEKIIIPEGKTIVTPICGGNIDMNLLSRIIEKGFLRNKRLLKVNVVISDRPGSLHQLTGILSALGANILNIQHDRISTHIPFYNTGTELILETKGEEHVEAVIAELEKHCQQVKVRT